MKDWNPEVPALAKRRGHLHLFADFDGTLAPIAPTPEQAVLPDETRALLARLVAQPRTTVAIVSGRPVETLREKVGLDGIVYVGNHGMELWRDGVRTEHPTATAARPAIARLAPEFHQLVQTYGGVLEDKGISLSLHTRLIVDEASRIRAERKAWQLADTEATLVPSGGKRIVEVKPRGAPHKGDAIVALLQEQHGQDWPASCAAIFLGDDVTDEDGFRALGGSGLTVFVSDAAHPRESEARFIAHGIADAVTLLRSLL